MSDPLFVYFTRPEAQEIYMGGMRRITMWLNPPTYSHKAHNEHFHGRRSEIGWREDMYQHGRAAKKWLKQDSKLMNLVWDKVFWSVLPKGMSSEQGEEWMQKPVDNPPRYFDGYPIDNWTLLADDRSWEAKCNLCHKRFVLKVDIRNITAELITPYVIPAPKDQKDQVAKDTLEITPYMATRYWVPDAEHDGDIPF